MSPGTLWSYGGHLLHRFGVSADPHPVCQHHSSADPLKSYLEPIPELDVCRSASKFFVCRSSKTADSLYGFQGFRAKADEKFAGKMRADNSGIGS